MNRWIHFQDSACFYTSSIFSHTHPHWWCTVYSCSISQNTHCFMQPIGPFLCRLLSCFHLTSVQECQSCSESFTPPAWITDLIPVGKILPPDCASLWAQPNSIQTNPVLLPHENWSETDTKIIWVKLSLITLIIRGLLLFWYLRLKSKTHYLWQVSMAQRRK